MAGLVLPGLVMRFFLVKTMEPFLLSLPSVCRMGSRALQRRFPRSNSESLTNMESGSTEITKCIYERTCKKISKDKSKETTVEESSVILRGGEVEDNTSETFFLESGVDKLNLDTMTSSEDTIVTLISPSGKSTRRILVKQASRRMNQEYSKMLFITSLK